jgi:hypothetical protein
MKAALWLVPTLLALVAAQDAGTAEAVDGCNTDDASARGIVEQYLGDGVRAFVRLCACVRASCRACSARTTDGRCYVVRCAMMNLQATDDGDDGCLVFFVIPGVRLLPVQHHP